MAGADHGPFASGATWRQWLGPTDAPARWGLVAAIAAGLVVGAAAGLLFPAPRGAILSGLTAGLVAAAGASGPRSMAVRLSGLAAVFGVVAIVLAFTTIGHPVWAAVAMAVVAVLASLAAGAGPIGAALGSLGLLAYVLAVAVGVMTSLRAEVSLGGGIGQIVVGGLAGLVVTAVGVVLRGRLERDEPPGPSQLPALWAPMAHSLRSWDEHARDGVRRAVPLGVGIALVETQATRDAVWIFVAAFVVLLPTGKPPVPVMLARVGTTIVAVVVLGLLALVVPHGVLFGAAIALVLAGTAYGNRFPLPGSAATTMGAVLFAGAPGDAIGTWASHRLLDTIIGSTLALAATYLLWPRDPADASADASV